ncbi:putative ribonuclease H-like domain-containing protein [Tanacetum coccineum]
MVPRAVLMKSGLVSVNIARQVNAAHSKITVNAARPKSHFSKTAHSTVKRLIHKNAAFKNSNFNQRVNTIKDKNINTVRPKVVVNAARPKAVVNVVHGNNVNDVKASAYHLGKFDGKADEDFFIGYSLNSKAFRVYNSKTRIVDENFHIKFSESTPNVNGSGPNWLFDIDALTRTMNYEPIVAGLQSNGFTDPKSSYDDGSKPSSDDGKKVDKNPRKDSECNDQEKEDNVNSTNNVNTVGTNEVNVVGQKTSIELPFDPNMHALEDDSIFNFSRDDEDDVVIGDLQSATQTRNMSKNLEEHRFVSTIQQRTNHKDLQNCLFACFLSQEEPKKVIHALKDPSWIEAMQEELILFKLKEVWTLVDLPNRKRAIGSKWVFRNKKDKRGIVIRNKARLVAQGYTQEEGIDYDEAFVMLQELNQLGYF